MAYYCPNCSEPVKNSDFFCPNCGVKLTDDPVDVDVLRKEYARTSGNVQFQEQVQDPIDFEEDPADPYEEYQRHTYDYKGPHKKEPGSSYTYERSGVEYFTDNNWPIRSRTTAGILAILFGGIGIHKFYLGKTGEGIAMLLLAAPSCGITALVGLIEGIIYLTQSDEEFSIKNKVRVN